MHFEIKIWNLCNDSDNRNEITDLNVASIISPTVVKCLIYIVELWGSILYFRLFQLTRPGQVSHYLLTDGLDNIHFKGKSSSDVETECDCLHSTS